MLFVSQDCERREDNIMIYDMKIKCSWSPEWLGWSENGGEKSINTQQNTLWHTYGFVHKNGETKHLQDITLLIKHISIIMT